MSEAILWIKDHIRHQGVLVVCKAGIGRSPSIVIGYLCSIGFGYDEAVRFVGSKRGDISPVPNLAFSIEDCIGFYLCGAPPSASAPRGALIPVIAIR